MTTENHALLRALTKTEPDAPGMYLYMMHGRTSPDEQLADWGSDGPFIGPLAWCHITYMCTINICALVDDTGGNGTGPMSGPGADDPMYFTQDLLFYDGVYYGDWELQMHTGES